MAYEEFLYFNSATKDGFIKHHRLVNRQYTKNIILMTCCTFSEFFRNITPLTPPHMLVLVKPVDCFCQELSTLWLCIDSVRGSLRIIYFPVMQLFKIPWHVIGYPFCFEWFCYRSKSTEQKQGNQSVRQWLSIAECWLRRLEITAAENPAVGLHPRIGLPWWKHKAYFVKKWLSINNQTPLFTGFSSTCSKTYLNTTKSRNICL